MGKGLTWASACSADLHQLFACLHVFDTCWLPTDVPSSAQSCGGYWSQHKHYSSGKEQKQTENSVQLNTKKFKQILDFWKGLFLLNKQCVNSYPVYGLCQVASAGLKQS